MKIDKLNQTYRIRARRYRLELRLDEGLASLSNAAGEALLDFPLDVRIELPRADLPIPGPLSARRSGSRLTLQPTRPGKHAGRQRMIFNFCEDHFTFRYDVRFAGRQRQWPGQVEYFRDPELGLRIRHIKEGFCQPDRSDSEEDYRDVFPSASTGGLSSPSVMNIALTFANGTVGFGLGELSNATRFGLGSIFRGEDPWMGLRVDAMGGNLAFAPGEVYTGPELIVTFPADGWDSIATFRDVLQAEHPQEVPAIDDRPDWWKQPVYCTYGDQIMHFQPAFYSDRYWAAEGFNDQWVRRMTQLAEDRLGYREFPVLIDAFWQRPWDPGPESDPKRFPRMRELVDWLHDRGHRVLLWSTPLGAGMNTPGGRLLKQFGLKTHWQGSLSGQQSIDFSPDASEEYFQHIAQRFFGDGPEDLNADGMKEDFLMAVAPPEEGARYAQPENGMGMRASLRFVELFGRAARAVRPDVLLNYSACDPRYQQHFSVNRLHDTKISPLERERRARVSALACPDLLIDSDGAVMMSDWVEHTYIAAAIYSTPCLYYVDRFQDDIRMSDEFMRALGVLFEVCSRRTWGRPEFVDYGSWRLRRGRRVVGESYGGKLAWLQTGAKTLEAVCLTDQTCELRTHGRAIRTVTPRPRNLRIDHDSARGTFHAGQAYTITLA